MRTQERAAVAFGAFLALATATAVHAGGPLLVASDGSPVGWDTSRPIRYKTDAGGLGTRSHDAAVAEVESSFAAWAAIPSTAIRFENRGNLDKDIDRTNFGPYLGPFRENASPTGTNVVVFDEDGSIFDLVYGIGSTAVGFASPTFTSDGTTITPVGDAIPPGSKIIEGVIFLNGKFLDGVSAPETRNFEISDADFKAVLVHEIGHFSGLGHTQIHGLSHETKTDSPGTTTPVETMFPLLTDTEQASPERDDRVWLSALYPDPSFRPTTFSIFGRVLGSDGRSARGVNVIARNVADHEDAVSVVSGFDLLGTGKVVLPGLRPGASYTIETQAIDYPFVGSSKVGPFSPPVRVEAPPEHYNGARESSDPKTDDPDDFVALTGVAGQTVGGIDVRLNLQRFSVAHTLFDLPGEWSQVNGFTFGDFNGDRVPDFVSSQSGFEPGNLLRLHHGYGDGAFAPPVTIGRFSNAFKVVAGQFNAGVDDFLDFAAVSLSRVRVYLGDGQGGFEPPRLALDQSDFSSRRILNLSAGHVNDDPFVDLVLTVHDQDEDVFFLYSLLGSANGDFSSVSTELDGNEAVPNGPEIEIGDATGDGTNDVIGLDKRGAPALALLQGEGTGAFLARRVDLRAITRSLAGDALASGDFNQDGRLDVVVTDDYPVDGTRSFTRSFGDILMGSGNGEFRLSTRFEIPEKTPTALVTADLNNDGYLDIAATGARYAPGTPGSKVTITFGDGAGGVLGTETVWGIAPWPQQLSAVDLDNDTRLDLVVGTSTTRPPGTPSPANFAVLRQRRCGFSPAAAQGSVTFGGRDCAVPNRVAPEGCTAAELIEECKTGRGRSGVVPCAVAVVRRLRSQGVISYSEVGKLSSCIARAPR